MKAVIIGGGVIGLASAYYLAQDGWDVTLIEANAGVGRGASFGNGGQLSYSYVAPLASPSVLPLLPFYILSVDSPLRFRPALDPHQWRWCARFLRACTRQQSDLTTRRLLALSFYSRQLMRDPIERERIDFDYVRNGKLVVYSSTDSFAHAAAQLDYQRRLGCEQEVLDADACLRLEPALAHLKNRIVGGIYTPSEDAGDCYRFCRGLERLLQHGKRPATFVYGVEVERLLRAGTRILAVETGDGIVEADVFILAAGIASHRLGKTIGLDLPIYPLKGYSITLPVTRGGGCPTVSVTDYERKIVYARLGDTLRVAGIADIVGYDKAIDDRRIALLVAEARASFPVASDFSRTRPWAGLRPATPTGAPILGPSPFDNLLINAGHGALGFTLALGSGRVVADVAAGRAPAIPLDGFVLGETSG